MKPILYIGLYKLALIVPLFYILKIVLKLLFLCRCRSELWVMDVDELLSFLTPETRPDVKGHATEYLLGLSGNRCVCRGLVCLSPLSFVIMNCTCIKKNIY